MPSAAPGPFEQAIIDALATTFADTPPGESKPYCSQRSALWRPHTCEPEESFIMDGFACRHCGEFLCGDEAVKALRSEPQRRDARLIP